MARIEAEQDLQPSLLDRLTYDDATRLDPVSRSRGQHLRELRESVRRDIENLLNTRYRCLPLPDGLDELPLSMVNYGIPDFSGVDLAAVDRREEFRAAVEMTVRRFEPRFIRVSVTMREGGSDPQDRTIRFRIDALMYADPAPEPVTFDSVLDGASRAVAVTSER
jgi:type VI secretion system protein ImpF